MHTYQVDVPKHLMHNLNSFDDVKFQLLYILEMYQIRCVLRLRKVLCFPFEQAANVAQRNIKGWSTYVGSSDAYNGSAMGKLLSV